MQHVKQKTLPARERSTSVWISKQTHAELKTWAHARGMKLQFAAELAMRRLLRDFDRGQLNLVEEGR